MKFQPKSPPRKFKVGSRQHIEISHLADLCLAANEQVTLLTDDGKQWDVVRKNWGYYATPSLNGRLRNNDLEAALVQSHVDGKLFILLVEKNKKAQFEKYLADEDQSVVTWINESLLEKVGSLSKPDSLIVDSPTLEKNGD